MSMGRGIFKLVQWSTIVCSPLCENEGAKTSYTKRKELPRETTHNTKGNSRDTFPCTFGKTKAMKCVQSMYKLSSSQ